MKNSGALVRILPWAFTINEPLHRDLGDIYKRYHVKTYVYDVANTGKALEIDAGTYAIVMNDDLYELHYTYVARKVCLSDGTLCIVGSDLLADPSEYEQKVSCYAGIS